MNTGTKIVMWSAASVTACALAYFALTRSDTDGSANEQIQNAEGQAYALPKSEAELVEFALSDPEALLEQHKVEPVSVDESTSVMSEPLQGEVEMAASSPSVIQSHELSPTLQRSLENSKIYRTEEFTNADSDTNKEIVATLRSIREARGDNQ